MFIVNKMPQSLSAESYRSIRTSIKYSSVDNPIKTIVITSSNSSEGKSTVAGNLAFSLSQNGSRTLLIDCDLRKPSVHKKFLIPNDKGLTDVLFDKQDLKEVIKKIIGYCIPFIIINISNSIYNTTDMILIIRGLTNLGYSAKDVETISSIFTTWGSKLITIVKAFATGLTISLIPSIVSAYVKKDMDKANYYFNNSLKVLLFIITPLTIFLSIFAKEIWYIFYGQSYYGPIIFKYIILVAILDSAYIIFFSALQGLYKTKLVYICALSGITVNALLDLPLMYLFNRMGIYPYYGAITATVIGYIISLSIPIVSLYKNDGFRYNDTIKSLPKLIFSILIAIFMCIIYKNIMPQFNGFIGNMLYLGIIGLLTLIVFFLINKDTIIKLLKEKK